MTSKHRLRPWSWSFAVKCDVLTEDNRVFTSLPTLNRALMRCLGRIHTRIEREPGRSRNNEFGYGFEFHLPSVPYFPTPFSLLPPSFSELMALVSSSPVTNPSCVFDLVTGLLDLYQFPRDLINLVHMYAVMGPWGNIPLPSFEHTERSLEHEQRDMRVSLLVVCSLPPLLPPSFILRLTGPVVMLPVVVAPWP
jgi:hypothetical protein